ncbi:MAG: histidinol-phosphatase HisJ family protein [Bacillota bacterium]
MMPDYHIHTSRCGHARGEMPEYIARAREKGFKEIGFADHVPMYWLPGERRDPGLAMAEGDFPGYVGAVINLRKGYTDINVLLGVEVDYVPGWEKKASRVLSDHPFDYVIGSVHYIDGWAFDHPGQVDGYSRRDIEDVYRSYFDLLCRAAGSGLFDVIAHPDLVKKFGHRPGKAPMELYRQAAGAFARAGVCVEVNTAGLRYPAGEIYPALEFLRLCRVEGVPAVTGSDAHDPELVGSGFDQARALLLEAGYREVAVFRGRRREMIKV